MNVKTKCTAAAENWKCKKCCAFCDKECANRCKNTAERCGCLVQKSVMTADERKEHRNEYQREYRHMHIGEPKKRGRRPKCQG